jgi:hypothetical protein
MVGLCLALAPACGSTPSPTAAIPGAATDMAGFVGSWTGSWSEETTTSSKLDGTVELTVNAAGTVTGKMTNKTLSLDGAVTGTVTEGGVTSADFAYPKATLHGKGHVGIKEGKLLGALDISQNGSASGTLKFALTRSP